MRARKLLFLGAASVGAAVCVLVLSIPSKDAHAADPDGDGRDQTLSLVNDPTFGLVARATAFSTAPGDARLWCILEVQQAAYANTWSTLLRFGNPAPVPSGTTMTEADGVPLAWAGTVQTNDIVRLTVEYRAADDSVRDTEVLTVPVP